MEIAVFISLHIEAITGGQTAFANCFIASVLDTLLKLYHSGNPMILLISVRFKWRRSLESTGIIAPPPELLTANVGNESSKEYALIPLDLI